MTKDDDTRIGALIRQWRTRRRLSQLALALEAGISQRHLSFLESGRAMPSRDMVLLLAEQLELPLRIRNHLLLAAGFAPHFSERGLGDAILAPAMDAVRLVLDGHEPNPALAVDRHWNMVAANGAVSALLEGIDEPALMTPPVNVLRLSLHPDGLAPRIVNLNEWRAHLMHRLKRLNDTLADPVLIDLERELSSYPVRARGGPAVLRQGREAIAVPLRLRLADRVMSFMSTITVFGTPLDVTLSELAVETFFPADRETAHMLAAMAGRPRAAPLPAL